MVNRLLQKKIVLILLGFVTAAILSVALMGAINLNTPQSGMNTVVDVLAVLYIAIPAVLLLLGIYRFKQEKNKRFLIYTIFVLTSTVIIIPLLIIGLIVFIVGVFGIMPTPT